VWLIVPAPPAPQPIETAQVKATDSEDGNPASTQPAAAIPLVELPDNQLDREEIYQKLKKIGLALHTHHDVHRMFAPPVSGRPNWASDGRLKIRHLWEDSPRYSDSLLNPCLKARRVRGKSSTDGEGQWGYWITS